MSGEFHPKYRKQEMSGGCRAVILCNDITVLEPTGVPVTGTPSIYLEFNVIINRWTIYKYR